MDERGVARVGAEDGGAAFRYLRFRDPPYEEPALLSAADKIESLLAAGLDVFAYFRHEDEPTGPLYAARLLELINGPASV
jgi:hypothetical protein